MALFTDVNAVVSGVFRGVYTENNNQWSMLLGVITLDGSMDCRKLSPCHYKYPKYQFVCRSIVGSTLAELIRGLEGNAGLSIFGIPDLGKRESNLTWTESLIPSHAHEEMVPIRRLSSRVCSDVHYHDSKLVAYGMPFHRSAFSFIKEFFGWDKFHGSSDGRKGELFIDIPDRRGRLVLSEEDISFHCGDDDELSVVGAIDGDQVSLVSPQDKYYFEQEKALDVELWLVTNTNEIVDYCSSTEWEYRYGKELNNTDRTQLLDTISAGESEHCEFKTYIDLVNKDTKAFELEKTVCALSNHQGGKLFIGVDDETLIVGINERCKKGYKCLPREAAESYQKAVEKRLQESLAKNKCFNTFLIEHNELIVLVVNVHKSNGLNYLVSTRDAYIRRGASSQKMTPTEIQAFPAERDAFGREFFATEFSAEWVPTDG
ncbi:helix-turn-helix domain-containing protein [Microbulbifer sp. YPW1]|uniref:AlbA family DNA-binding domain-containing protein n=1 Tax=Microbulbifer sp. YPW1 TaxID=2745199 RepID=UPI00159A4363|nr:ATP-binding protein [Microbulbifer sp. YPW1]QKX18154.1 ATP-binding protein [Microbulbifer sp. YPW1]